MKILFVLPEYYPHSGGGISTYYLKLIPALKPYCTKIKVAVGSGYTQDDKNFIHEDITVEYVKPKLYQQFLSKFSKFDIFPEVKSNLAAAWAMWEQFKNDDYDIIECTDFGLGFIPWLIHHERPVTIRLHGSTGQISTYDYQPAKQLAADFIKQTELLFFSASDLLQTYSKANQTFWQQQLPFKKTVHLYPIYVNNRQMVAYQTRNSYGLVTGRIQQWKGPQILCEAAEILKDKMPQINWFGRDMPFQKAGSSMSNYLAKKYPANWGINIKPQPAVSYSEILKLQHNAKFGLITSIWDMFNFTCLEFLSAGTLTICADGAGASELIENGINGYVYPANEPADLADLLSEVNCISQKKYEQIASEGQQTIIRQLAPEVLIPAYVAAYQKTINEFVPSTTNSYMKFIYSPSDSNYKIDELLDLQPLKKLTIYNLKRIKTKISGLFN
ncbi:MAG: glycosyltransferase [Sphingobacteriaceae bacterium]|nr:MAG: glycosyltransferase [Sphingobacteriaceae bacterium]